MNNTTKQIKTYRNKNFTKRDYECTNVAACQSAVNPDPSKWVEDADAIKPTMQQLWIENGVRVFGWL